MNKIILFCVLVLFLLNSCTDTRSERMSSLKYFKKKHSEYNYFVKVQSPTTGKGYMAASQSSYADALNIAMEGCRSHGIYDCIIHTRGNTFVYNPPSKEDINIAKAQNACRKAGYTQGTDKFADCTIKMLSQDQGGQQTVIVGSGNQRNRLLRPYPLGCRSMGGMWNC